jgi:hypothetical protein
MCIVSNILLFHNPYVAEIADTVCYFITILSDIINLFGDTGNVNSGLKLWVD